MRFHRINLWLLGIIILLTVSLASIFLYFYFHVYPENSTSKTILLTSIKSADKLLEKGMSADALGIYDDVVSLISKEGNPFIYGHIKNNQGICYHNMSRIKNGTKNLAIAITAYNESLKIYTLKGYPVNYATTQANLGASYQALAEFEDREQNLARASQVYSEALKVYSIDNPKEYAMVNTSLGNVSYSLAGFRDTKENLTKSIDAFEEALKVYTLESHPKEFAMNKTNLGAAYQALSKLEDMEANLARSSDAYEEALKVYALENSPEEYAKVRNSLGASYYALAEFANDEENLTKAIEAYNEALKVYALRSPEDKAMAKGNPGNTDNNEEDTSDIMMAQSIDHAMIMSNLATTYYNLANLRDKEKNLALAIDNYIGALGAYTIEENPLEYSTINNYLGSAYQILGEIHPMRGNITRAVKAYNEALKVPRSKAKPLYNTKVKSNSAPMIYRLNNLQ